MAEHKFQCAVGDRSTPLSVRLWEPGKDNNIAALTVLFAMDTKDGTNWLAETSTGVTVMPGQTFTAAADTDKLTCNAHGLENGWEVVLSTSAADLPAGLTTTDRYFVIDATPNNFRLSLEPNGEKVNITDTGTGTHTIKAYGHVQYAWTANDVGTAGTYKAWFIVRDGSGYDRTFPNTEDGITVEVVTAN